MPKTKRPKLTKELLVQKYHTENMSLTEVAQDLGYSREHVYRTMKKFGIKRRTVSESNAGAGNSQYKDGPWRDPEVLKGLIQRNMTTREMAEELGISHTTLARSLRKLGLVSKRKKAHTKLSPEESKLAKTCPECLGKKAHHAKVCSKCRDRSGVNNPMYGKKHKVHSKILMSKKQKINTSSDDYINPSKFPEVRKKQRISALRNIEKRAGQVMPNYNPGSIEIIERYALDHGLNLQHAENGGEYHIRELGYFLDAYDKDKNVVVEVDERHHYDIHGNLRDKDITRQNEIIKHLGCQFVRIDYETGDANVY